MVYLEEFTYKTYTASRLRVTTSQRLVPTLVLLLGHKRWKSSRQDEFVSKLLLMCVSYILVTCPLESLVIYTGQVMKIAQLMR